MGHIPESLRAALAEALGTAGDQSDIVSIQSVAGGCITHVIRVETCQSPYLLKWYADGLPGMFLAEAHGLALLRATEAIRIPYVFAASDEQGDQPAYILLEWIESKPGTTNLQAMLGRQLATMHQIGTSPQQPPAYGLDQHNYLGRMLQYNGWNTDWISFYREQRLMPQITMAERLGRMPMARRSQLEQLMQRLDTWFGGVTRCPALLHGDLWHGNVLADEHGMPVIIDPAVYYGDRELEIAYTELFGGFSGAFYAAYHEVWPLDGGYHERRDLYNLYHLLNHLNHFGESYGAQVDAVVRYYVGKIS